MQTLSSRLPHHGTTIFTVMSELSRKHNAINLAQGFPGFDCDEELKELVIKYTQEGHNQYAPMSGVQSLKEALSSKTADVHQASYDPQSEITITSGATEALFATISAITTPGDEIMVLEPAYDSYIPAILLSGGKPVFVPLTVPDFHPDWDAITQAITPKTKAVLINTPHNPTGYVWTADDMKQLEKLVAKHGVYVISDEVYEHITFDHRPHLSVSRSEILKEHSFVIGSFGKTYHITGWKIGYCLAPAPMTTEFRKIHQFLTFCTHTPSQWALAEYLKLKKHYEQLPDFYEKKRDYFTGLLSSLPFKFTPAQGSYFQLVDYSSINDLPDKEFAIWLTEKIGVSAIPVSAFFQDGTDHRLIRFCFAKKEMELEAAAERLHLLVS